jgi:hypothetical protein
MSTARIHAQLDHVIKQLLPLTERMLVIDAHPNPPTQHDDFTVVRELVSGARQMLLNVPTTEDGREVAQRIADAQFEAVARWNSGQRGADALARATALHEEAVALTQRTGKKP